MEAWRLGGAVWTGENEAFRKRRRRVAITPTCLATVLLFIAVAAVVSTKIKNKNIRESFAKITANDTNENICRCCSFEDKNKYGPQTCWENILNLQKIFPKLFPTNNFFERNFFFDKNFFRQIIDILDYKHALQQERSPCVEII